MCRRRVDNVKLHARASSPVAGGRSFTVTKLSQARCTPRHRGVTPGCSGRVCFTYCSKRKRLLQTSYARTCNVISYLTHIIVLCVTRVVFGHVRPRRTKSNYCYYYYYNCFTSYACVSHTGDPYTSTPTHIIYIIYICILYI
jgi:hypothetical protein